MTGARRTPRVTALPEGEPPATFASTAQPDPFQFLVAEHALLRRDVARELLASGTRPLSKRSADGFDSLAARFRLHTDREDDVLAPICERLFGGREGAAAVMRTDHEELRKALESLPRGARTSERRREKLEALRSRLESHFAKEERVLFPLMAALLSSREAASLARRLRVLAVPGSGR